MLTLHSIALLLNHLVLSHGWKGIAWWLQIGEVRQQVVEAHRRCTDQQATIVQLHQRLLDSQQNLQANSPIRALLGHPGLLLQTEHSCSWKYQAQILLDWALPKADCMQDHLVTCTDFFRAPQAHHSIAVSGVCALMSVMMAYPKELPLGSNAQ